MNNKTTKTHSAKGDNGNTLTGTKSKDRHVKTINVKPLMPLQRLNSNRDVKVETGMTGNSPKEKCNPPGSIHEILKQMQVSPDSPDAKAGMAAANRWKQRSAKEIYDDFCSETSFTALTRIHKASHWAKRILWLVACISMMVWLTIQCVWLFEKYFSYPVEVKIEVRAVPNLEFPSVTICNINPLRRSRMWKEPFWNVSSYFMLDDSDMLYDNYKEDKLRTFQEDNFTDYEYDDAFWQSFMMRESFNKWDTLRNDTELAEQFYNQMDDSHLAMFVYSTVAVTLSEEDVKQFGHQKEDFILSCTWKGISCSPANFTYHRSNFYGNCYTFNSFNNGMAARSTNYAGPLMGLVLELNIEQSEYISALSPDAGIRMVIHQRGTYPIPEDEGINIPPGYKTSIGLDKMELVRLPPPHGDCGEGGSGVTNLYTRDFGTDYSKQTCLKSCLQQELLENCGCMMALFYVPRNVPVCSMLNENITSCGESIFNTKISECNDRCPSPCDDVKYDLTMSMSKWPSDQYADHLDKKIMKSMSEFMYDEGRRDSDKTLAKIEIYYKELMSEKVEQQRAYESQNLISDIGGQLGLWLGLSAITVGEILEFIASLSRAVFAKFCRKRRPEPDLLDMTKSCA